MTVILGHRMRGFDRMQMHMLRTSAAMGLSSAAKPRTRSATLFSIATYSALRPPGICGATTHLLNGLISCTLKSFCRLDDRLLEARLGNQRPGFSDRCNFTDDQCW